MKLTPEQCKERHKARNKAQDSDTCRRTEQIYVAIPLKDKGLVHTALQDFIRYIGALSFIVVDSVPEENRGEWLSVCRMYCIPQQTTEPEYQNQNRAERQIDDIKWRAK